MTALIVGLEVSHVPVKTDMFAVWYPLYGYILLL